MTSLSSNGKVTCSLGEYLAARLEQAGVRHYFTVPGDFNLLLLDELLKSPRLQLIGCCNELNAGYAAEGYARSNGVGALVVTYSVGGLGPGGPRFRPGSRSPPNPCAHARPQEGTRRSRHATRVARHPQPQEPARTPAHGCHDTPILAALSALMRRAAAAWREETPKP